MPQDLLDGLRDETRNLPRIVAVARGLVVGGQDQLTEFNGHLRLVFHGLLSFRVGGFRSRAPRVAELPSASIPQLQQVPGRQFVCNEFGSLRDSRRFCLVCSFKVK